MVPGIRKNKGLKYIAMPDNARHNQRTQCRLMKGCRHELEEISGMEEIGDVHAVCNISRSRSLDYFLKVTCCAICSTVCAGTSPTTTSW